MLISLITLLHTHINYLIPLTIEVFYLNENSLLFGPANFTMAFLQYYAIKLHTYECR